MAEPHAAKWCTNFQSAGEHDVCRAGVRFDTFRQVPFHRRPCFLTDKAESKPGAVSCASLRRQTADEIAADHANMMASGQRLLAVIAATAEWRLAHQDKNATDVLPCPICQGRLHVAIGRSGHMAGKCETQGCVRWIE